MLKKLKTTPNFFRSYDQLLLTGDAPVLVAISGGSDSTALLVGLQEYFKQSKTHTDIVAVTIDHGLRPEAAQEARQVGDLCATLGIKHIVKNCQLSANQSGVQAAARALRYSLISEAAREIGAQIVLTGHTLDDQLETIAMRSERGEGRGLAGISNASLFERSTWFVRPLLGTTRSELRTYLSARDIGWVDDPSNNNREFERVRVRQSKISSAQKHQLLSVQSTAQMAREAAAGFGADFIRDARKLSFDDDTKTASLNLDCVDDEGFEPALQTVMCKIGGRSHFASAVIMKQIYNFARSGKDREKFTAQACLLTIRAGRLDVSLEKRAQPSGIYCFDYLLPITEFALANALNSRLNRPELPLLPIKSVAR